MREIEQILFFVRQPGIEIALAEGLLRKGTLSQRACPRLGIQLDPLDPSSTY